MGHSSGLINWQWLVDSGRIQEASSNEDYILVGSFDTAKSSIASSRTREYMIKVSDFMKLSGGEGLNLEGYTESGTRAGLDMYVGLGDYDDSGDGTKITIDDNLGEIAITGQALFAGGDIVISNGGGLKLDATGFEGTLQASTLTATRDIQMPDASGTIALTNNLPTEMSFAGSDQTTPLVVATNIAGMFAEFDMTLQSLFVGVGVLGTGSGGTRIQIQKNGVDILTVVATIDFGESTSLTAAAPVVIDPAQTSIEKGDRISVDIIGLSGGATEAGLQIVLNGIRA